MRKASFISITAIVSAIAAPAGAQTRPVEPKLGQIEDIVVTARRTDESLQTTPVAVSAFNSAALERAQVTQVADLQGRAPNLSIAVGGTSAPTQAQLAIRGQAQNSPGTNSDPAVGIYVDGVYIARPIAANVDVLDLGRVEILRGPQGTLFGRNTIGGALSLTTKQPTGEFEGLIRVGAGNYSQRLIEGVVNVPIKDDELAVRAVFRTQKHDGYGSYPALDDRPAGKVLHDDYGRLGLRWAPTELPLTLAISADYSRYSDTGQQQTLLGFNSGFELAPGFTIGKALSLFGVNPADYTTTSSNFRKYYGYNTAGKAEFNAPYDKGTAKGISATLDVDFDDVHLKSISSYRKSLIRDVEDISGLPVNLVVFDGRFAQNQISQELNLSTTIDSFDLIGGVFYFRERGEESTHSQSFGFLNPAGPAAQTVSTGTDADVVNTSKAAYAQVNYHFTDKLRGTAGLRYTWDEREVLMHNQTNRSDPTTCAVIRDIPGGPCDQTRSRGFSYPAWTVGLDYQATDTLFLYAKTSGASMAGGWNVRDSISPAFEPEEVRDVELGFKNDLFDHKLRTNAAVFYAWSSQVQRIVNAYSTTFKSITQYIQNAGEARTYGAELEATALPWEGMEITGSAAVLRANYTKFEGAQLVAGVPVTVDRKDELVPQSPRLTYSLGATQTVGTSLGDLSFHADYAYVSSRAFYQDTASPLQPDNVKAIYDQANKFGMVKAYGLLNAKIALNLKQPNVEIALWGRNLTDEQYLNVTSTFYTSFGPAMGFPGVPRTYGATVTYNW